MRLFVFCRMKVMQITPRYGTGGGRKEIGAERTPTKECTHSVDTYWVFSACTRRLGH